MINLTKIIVAALVLSCSSLQALDVQVQIVRGADCAPVMSIVSALRLKTFREFPYLYVGTEELEQGYVGDYPDNPDSLIAFAYVGDGLMAGFLTGTPLQTLCKKDPVTQAACEQAGLVVADYFYLGEVITLEQFRNKGIATQNFNAIEESIKKLGYKNACFITVEREENHPLKPAGYKGPASLFQKLGYTKTDMRVPYAWPTIQTDGTIKTVNNTVAVWVKEL